MIAEFCGAAAPDIPDLTHCPTCGAPRHNVAVLKRLLCSALLLPAFAGCSATPERDARGNPKIERLTEQAREEEQRRELYRYPYWPSPPYWGGYIGVPRRNWGFFGYW